LKNGIQFSTIRTRSGKKIDQYKITFYHRVMKVPGEEIDSSATCGMILDPDHGFGLLSSEDQERLERILNERSEGVYGVLALHGMLTSSVVGPKP
jgi:hypothetical protein